MTVADEDLTSALIGTTALGVYEILDVVGQGGMSVVYKARHQMTEQIVALKILPAELAVHPGLRARFVEEAKALARLEHPGIVHLYHFGEEGGRFVLAMQFIGGETFERRIQRSGRLRWRDAVDVICQVLDALEYAHRLGIVHRDVKPSNIIVRPDGSAMVMDFGIAKMSAESSRLTATGQTMGTVRYMSPEQVRGKNVDARTDIYSLGASLFEAVTGETPYDGDTHFEIMSKHLTEPPPSPRGRGAADIPVELESAIVRSLAKDPKDRYGSALEFRAALDAIPDRAPRDTDPTSERVALRVVSDALAETDHAHALGASASMSTPRPASSPLPSVRPRGRARVWLALAALVVAASAGVMALVRMPRQNAAASAPAATATAAPAPATWPEPVLPPGFTPRVDSRRAALRVLTARDLDIDAVVRRWEETRTSFAAYLQRQRIGEAIATLPANLVVAPPETMCAPAIWAPAAPPPDCAERRYRYLPDSRTLYVLDSANLETINLPQGASFHMCVTTEALLQKGCARQLLPAFWDEVEASARAAR